MHVHIVLLLWCEKGIVYQQVIRMLVYYSYLFTKFHTSKHLGKRVTQHACSHCFLLWCKNSIVYQQVIRMLVLYIINPYQFTKFHTSKHLSKRVTQTCMFTLFFVVVRKGYCLPVIRMLVSYQYSLYLFTKFHASKHFGKRVTQTCMPYCNVWAEVVYCGFPKSKVFTKTLICLFSVCHQSLYLHHVSYMWVYCG